MSSMRSDHSSRGSNINSRNRLLDAVAPMLRERYSCLSKQTNHPHQLISNSSVVTKQPHRRGPPTHHSVCRPLEFNTTSYKSTGVALKSNNEPASDEQNNNNPSSTSVNNTRVYGSTTQLRISSTIDETDRNSCNLFRGCSSSDNDQSIFINEDGQLVDKIKTKLSLSRDTTIPRSFILKQKFKHSQPLKSDGLDDADDFDAEKKIVDELSGLSRLERQKTLSEIGFGQASSYVKSHVLGAGTYSIVYKGTSRLTKKLVALKEIHLERDEGIPFTAIREISLLKQLKHCNIITLHDIISTSRTLTLVFEYVDCDLSRYMDLCDHKINSDNVRLFLYQLLRSLKYCHSKKILHRDIKPQNILIGSSGELKLADFGLARAKSIPTKTFTDEVVTLWYRPPDVLLGNTDYGTSIDMWGVGCIFFEMIAGYILFTGVDPRKQIECIFEIVGTPRENDWPNITSDLELNSVKIPRYPGRDLANMAPRLDEDGADLLGKLLKCNPNSRISSSDAIRHKYFTLKLPEGTHDLMDSESIFSMPEVHLAEEEFLPNESMTSSLNN